jgi:hypothetical protein
MLNKNSNSWLSKEYISTNIEVAVDDSSLIQDTYISNEASYADSGDIIYSARNTIKTGGQTVSNRAILLFDIEDYIKNSLSSFAGYTAGMDYSVLSATLTLDASDGKTAGTVYGVMLPTGISVDSTASWTRPSQEYGVTWEDGGTTEPLADGISAEASWSGSTVSFNITPFVNIWLASGAPNFGIMLRTDETSDETWEFYSQQADSPLLGGEPVTNALFLGAGDTNSINTEGIMVKISPQLPYLTVESADPSATATNRWAAFNASVSIGDTFSMFLPDLNTNSQVYTLLDKRNSETGDIQLIVSGSTAGFETTKHATGEFSCVGRVQSGSGIVEFSSPDNSLKVDMNTVLPNDTIIFDYKPTITPNNATSFTVDFYLDETLKNNRARLYLKQQTASENRSGLNTSVKKSSVRPRLSLNLLV